MKDTPLNQFVEKIMVVGNGFMGMGNASVGIIGATTANDQAYNYLRKNTLDFAAEYSKPRPDHDELINLAGKVEGSLQTAKVLYGISDSKLNELLDELDGLVELIPAK